MKKSSYYSRHKEELKMKAKEWSEKNPEARKAINHKYNVGNGKSVYRKWHQIKSYGTGDLVTIESRCMGCGLKKDLVVHHADGNNGRNGKTLNNSLDNLVILCRRCHPRFHGRWGLKEVMPYGV
jgi:hypothetical protein